MGLTNEEVLTIRKKVGWNEIIPSKIESRFEEIKNIILDPMGLMLLALGFFYLILGQTKDAVILFICYIPVTAVDVALEYRAKKALAAMRATLKKIVKVIRNGLIEEIDIRELVPGDVIVFEEGQTLPADGAIVEANYLQISEAVLTGESVPLDKIINDKFFSGTTILQGRGQGLIEKIGSATAFGKIAKLIEQTELEESPLKKKINKNVKKLIYIALFISFVLFIFTFYKERDLANSLILALTFGMASIPEEFPLVYTLYLSMGAYRLSKHGVLVKSLPHVESLGSVDVICTDKTGTLTEGKFQLESIWNFNINIEEKLFWQSALMACEENVVDAMEVAIFEKGKEYKNSLEDWQIRWDNLFDQNSKYMSHIWQNNSTKEMMLTMKGSAEGVIQHCALSLDEKEQINEKIVQLAKEGKRILALSFKKGLFSGDRLKDESNLDFLGLLVFSDPVRSSAKQAVLQCQKSGIVVKMLTGDHPITAHAVADELGLLHSHEYLFTGEDIKKLSVNDRNLAYEKGAVFSRLMPEQKYEMVQALKASGKVVAMTGDGINDAPALKMADIGISMGKDATDVARSSAQMILMENDFSGIVEAVLEGRKIFSNLRRSFSYLISFHLPIVFFTLLPPILGLGTLLLPIQIIVLEIIVHPVSAFAFENLPPIIESDNTTLVSGKNLFHSLLAGILTCIVGLVFYYYSMQVYNQGVAHSVVLLSILFGNIYFVFLNSLPIKGMRFYVIIALLFLIVFILFYIESVSKLFYLNAIPLRMVLLVFAGTLVTSIPSYYVHLFSKD